MKIPNIIFWLIVLGLLAAAPILMSNPLHMLYYIVGLVIGRYLCQPEKKEMPYT